MVVFLLICLTKKLFDKDKDYGETLVKLQKHLQKHAMTRKKEVSNKPAPRMHASIRDSYKGLALRLSCLRPE